MPRRRPPSRPDDAPPRTEAEWEAELARTDLISDRVGELMETLIDDPDRAEKIRREMGWDDDDADDEAIDPEVGAEIDEINAAASTPNADEDWSGDSPLTDDERSASKLLAMPAYALARNLWRQMRNVLESRVPGSPDDEVNVDGETTGELFDQALTGVGIAGAKLNGAHAIGCDDDVVCAVIVRCRQASAAAVDGRAAWVRIRDRGLVDAATVDQLLAEHDEVIRLIEQHIADLRSRVYW